MEAAQGYNQGKDRDTGDRWLNGCRILDRCMILSSCHRSTNCSPLSSFTRSKAALIPLDSLDSPCCTLVLLPSDITIHGQHEALATGRHRHF